MNKEEFKKFLLENYYQYCRNSIFDKMLDNILDYAGKLEEIEQYRFLCDMLPNVPEVNIRNTYFSNEEERGY